MELISMSEAEKSVLFNKADYFIRNWIINEDTSIGNECKTKFCGVFETILDLDLMNEYAEYKA